MANDPALLTYRELVSDFDMAQDRAIGNVTDDGRWSERAIIRKLHQSRATLIRRDMGRAPGTHYRRLRQTLNCIPLEKANTEQCPCPPPSGCVWARTRFLLPASIGEYLSVHSIGGNLEQVRSYQFIDWYNYKWKVQSRFDFVKDLAYYTLRDSRIYFIWGDRDIEKYLSVTMIAEDPLKIFDYVSCDGKRDPCFSPLDQEFLFDPGRVDELRMLAIKGIADFKGIAPFDKTNDDQPATGVEGQQK